jgi:UDP-2,3-diacylglucosamine pyrophosphatase LpxH
VTMPSCMKRVDRAFASAPVLAIDEGSKIAVLSDCHRGAGNRADDFARNQSIFLAALEHYDRLGYTYIELGDGDELWENKSISEIKAAHGDVFRLLKKFYGDKRLWLLYGNHDMEKKCEPALFDTYCDAVTSKELPLFPGAAIHEGLRLRYAPAGRDFFLLHGHQVDFLNDTLWRLARFLVRNVWRPLELLGFNDPTSAAKNHKVKRKTERRLTRWADENGTPLLAGHTHRPVFPLPGEGRYFNDGCCVHPGYVTAMEIAQGRISLVKWGQKAREDGTVYIGKDVIAGPAGLEEYFE